MSDYLLSIIVYGRGDDPNHRSHWAFAIHRPGSELCSLYHVYLIGEGLIYQFEERSGQPLESQSSEGYFLVGHIKASNYTRTKQILSQEPAPRNGRDRCQDWAMNCIIELETEELVEDGTSELISKLIGKNLEQLKAIVQDRWTGVQRR